MSQFRWKIPSCFAAIVDIIQTVVSIVLLILLFSSGELRNVFDPHDKISLPHWIIFAAASVPAEFTCSFVSIALISDIFKISTNPIDALRHLKFWLILNGVLLGLYLLCLLSQKWVFVGGKIGLRLVLVVVVRQYWKELKSTTATDTANDVMSLSIEIDGSLPI